MLELKLNGIIVKPGSNVRIAILTQEDKLEYMSWGISDGFVNKKFLKYKIPESLVNDKYQKGKLLDDRDVVYKNKRFAIVTKD